jgi:hypothetical protein
LPAENAGELVGIGFEIDLELVEGFIEDIIKAGVGGIDAGLGADDAGDGGRCQVEDTEQVGMMVEIGGGVEGFDETAGVDTNEGELFDEAGDISGFEAIQIALADAAGIEAVLEVIEVAGRGATATGSIGLRITRSWHKEVLWG